VGLVNQVCQSGHEPWHKARSQERNWERPELNARRTGRTDCNRDVLRLPQGGTASNGRAASTSSFLSAFTWNGKQD
jgi:hypothetical protein